jgi:hypothetical protein
MDACLPTSGIKRLPASVALDPDIYLDPAMDASDRRQG